MFRVYLKIFWPVSNYSNVRRAYKSSVKKFKVGIFDLIFFCITNTYEIAVFGYSKVTITKKRILDNFIYHCFELKIIGLPIANFLQAPQNGSALTFSRIYLQIYIFLAPPTSLSMSIIMLKDIKLFKNCCLPFWIPYFFQLHIK